MSRTHAMHAGYDDDVTNDADAADDGNDRVRSLIAFELQTYLLTSSSSQSSSADFAVAPGARHVYVVCV